jgi:acyl carrier protein
MGIDSLMDMELIREVHVTFKCTLEADQLMGLTDFQSLVLCTNTKTGVDLNDIVDGEQKGETRP